MFTLITTVMNLVQNSWTEKLHNFALQTLLPWPTQHGGCKMLQHKILNRTGPELEKTFCRGAQLLWRKGQIPDKEFAYCEIEWNCQFQLHLRGSSAEEIESRYFVWIFRLAKTADKSSDSIYSKLFPGLRTDQNKEPKRGLRIVAEVDRGTEENIHR